MAGDEPKKPGRKLTPIDWDAFDTLAQMHATLAEFAFFFSCSEDTIERACRREKGMRFADYYAIRCVGGRLSLRRRMWEQAINKDNPEMQRFLSKQPESKGGLGFSDKITNEVGEQALGSYERMMGICNELIEEKKKE